jgi:predicted Zn-dependent protease
MINKSFILFIAQILYTSIYKKMIDNNLFSKMTLKELLHEMSKIKSLNFNNKRYIRPLTKLQKNIFDCFSIKYPE